MVPSLSVVVPAYNEERNVGAVGAEILRALDRAGVDHELILVDDGSADGTLTEMMNLRATTPSRVRLVRHTKNGGIGHAVRTGFKRAKLDCVVFLPADGQVTANEALVLLGALGDNDLVISSYRQRGAVDGQLRLMLSLGLRLGTRLLSGVERHFDGITLFRRSLLGELPLQSTTFFVNLELPLRAILGGRKHAHCQIDVRPRRSGKSKVVRWRVIRAVGSELLRFRFDLLREKFERKPTFLADASSWPHAELE
jgi:glycosyltransferase involved in cell wall biosynthesis